jgi:hypothetical protein
MRSKLACPLFLVFLHACTTAPNARDASPPAESARPPAAASAAPAPAAAGPGAERTYRSPVPLCFDAALRVCREREIVVRSQERGGDQSGTLRGEGRAFEFTLSFAKTPGGRTRASLLLQGRAAREQRDQAARLLDGIGDALLEPRD